MVIDHHNRTLGVKKIGIKSKQLIMLPASLIAKDSYF